MAYPQVIGAPVSVVENTDSISHSITLPGSLAYQDLVVIAIVMRGPNTRCLIDTASSSDNWDIWHSCHNTVMDVSTEIVWCKAKGSGLDFLTLKTDLFFVNPENFVYSLGDYATTTAYIGYRITEGIMSKYSFSSGSTSNWIASPCPEIDDSVSLEYLWIISAGSQHEHIANTAPSGFSNLVTAQGAPISYCVSMSSCRREWTGSQHPMTSFLSAPTSHYEIYFLGIKPSSDIIDTSCLEILVPSGHIGII
jgi:hypothetical protein